jgi:replicative DNA helicase
MATAVPRRYPDDAESVRLPPHSVESEQAVLGGLMLDAVAWDAVADIVRPGDFYRRDHQLIFEAIAELIENRSPCDAITIFEALGRKGLADEAGGLAYLARLARDTPSAANVRAYANIVRDHSLLRQLVSAGGEIASSALETQGRTPTELVEEAEQKVFAIAERGARNRSGFQSVKELLPQTIDRIDMLHQNPGAFTGVPTGYSELDRMTTGFQRGDLVIIAARPSMGKTTLAINIAENAAIDRGMRVAIFSMEMSAEQLTLRMISSLGRVSQGPLRTGQLSAEDWPRITTATEILSKANIYIDETPSLTPTDMRARARRLKREKGLDLIVVDYLQLMQVAGTKENRTNEISEISRSLKALAKELHCPVIALSQLNRSVEQRTEKKPVMSDLRECVTGDTLVCLADGRRRPIRELVGETPRVWAMDERERIVPADAELVWEVGTKPVFDVRLASGRKLRATAQHRMYTARGWRTVAQLSELDSVACAAQHTHARWHETIGALALDISSEPVAELVYERVVGVALAGEEPVYDLTVPGPSSWLADGIVSHNSGAIEQDADLILMIYREEVYEPNTPRKGIADIIITKQRNGPTGEVHLTFLGEFTRFENLVAESYGEGAFR